MLHIKFTIQLVQLFLVYDREGQGPDWPWICGSRSTSASEVLGLQACALTPGSVYSDMHSYETVLCD